MKNESYNVEAFLFRIFYKKYGELNFQDEYEVRSIYDNDNQTIGQISFSQVDGLTIEQFFEVFHTKSFILSIFINKTDLRIKGETQLWLVGSLGFNSSAMSDEERKMEISALIAKCLLDEQLQSKSPQLLASAIATFLERYRGLDYAEVSTLKKQLKISARPKN